MEWPTMLIHQVTAIAVMESLADPNSQVRTALAQEVGGGLGAEIEGVLFHLAGLFLWPVLVAVVLSLAYALVSTGSVAAEWIHRRRHPGGARLLRTAPDSTIEGLELAILRDLEGLRICSRVTPMLGLIATMIPLGPTLVGMTDDASAAALSSLAPAFSTVILSLVAASVSFVLLTVRRRWLLEELHQLDVEGRLDA